MTKVPGEITENVREFVSQLINRPLPEEHLWVGSFFELPLMYFFQNVTDVDTMAFSTHFSVLPSTNQEYQNPRNTSQHIPKDAIRGLWAKSKELQMHSRGSHVGFTGLFDLNENRDFKRIDLKRDGSNGPSREYNLIPRTEFHEISLKMMQGMCLDLRQVSRVEKNHHCASEPNEFQEGFKYSSLFSGFFSGFKDFKMDWVDCIHCQVWPKDAKEWPCRKRQYDWPPPDIVNTIINDGCFLVNKPHLNDPGADQFRISLSKAELILIRSWNNIQKHIYHILRLIKGDVVKKCGGKDACHLKTYHFKTLMFWSCESNPAEFWKIDNRATSLKALLCTMIEWMIEKECRNYFISCYNLWDYLPDDFDFEEEAQCILYAIENIHMYVDKTVGLLDKLIDLKSNEIRFFFPNKLLFILQMRSYHAYILNPSLPGREKHTVANSFEKNDYVCSKFVHLYDTISRHSSFTFMNLENKSKSEISFDILKSFRQCKEVDFDGFTELVVSPCDDGHQFTKKILEANIGNLHENDNFQRKTYSDDDIMTFKCVPIIQSFIEYLDATSESPFFILSYAYEANFHYTGFVDCPDFKDHCQEALDLCDEGLKLCTELQGKATFWITVIPELLPVLVTNKWLHIFDRHIAASLKSYFSFEQEFENTNFVIHFSPQHFLKYVRLQCMRILGHSFDEESEMTKMMDNLDPHPNTEVLRRALINSKG